MPTDDDIPTIAPAPRAVLVSRIAGPMTPPPGRDVPPWRDRSFPPRLKDFQPPPPSPVPLIVTLIGYGVMMAVTVGGVIAAAIALKDESSPVALKDAVIHFTAVVEGIDTLLVLVLIAATWRPPVPKPFLGPRWVAWLVSVPALAAMLGVNVGYHTLLRALANVKPERQLFDIALGDGWLAIGLLCLQPAVVEELMFRFLILGHLRRFVPVHVAVWISSVLFGIAHIGAPLSVPVLILLGAGLGYSRVWGRTLALPMILHFLHNFVVLLINEALLNP
jgi:membrane protease YdiL (CAAX protease family)